MNSFSRQLFRAAAAIWLLVVGVLGVAAQASRAVSTVERRMETMSRQAKDFERDDMARDQNKKNDPEAAKRSRQIRIEIEEDLKSLQNIYNRAATALQTATDLQPGYAAETGRTVRKHALRLKTNLALPSTDVKEEKAEPPPLPSTDRKALSLMCRVIYDFVTNPMFEGTSGLDARNAAKASSDLDAIIRVAEHLSGIPATPAR